MILGVVGTLPFDRLVRLLDDYAARNPTKRVLIQTANAKFLPNKAEHFGYVPRKAILALFREASVLVTHAGIGTLIDASGSGTPVVLVPRLSALKEHIDDHQLQIARFLAT